MSSTRPPEIPAVPNQRVLVGLLQAVPRPWTTDYFNSLEVLVIAYSPCTQWPSELSHKVEALLARAPGAGVRSGRHLPRVIDWPSEPEANLDPAASGRSEGRRRHCITLLLTAHQDREDAEKWPGIIRTLVDDCARTGSARATRAELGSESQEDRPDCCPPGQGTAWDQRRLEFLEAVEDGLCYVIESLLQDFTGEAKGELSTLLQQVQSNDDPACADRGELLTPLREALAVLRGNSYDITARNRLIELRRRIHETRRTILGRRSAYSVSALSCLLGRLEPD